MEEKVTKQVIKIFETGEMVPYDAQYLSTIRYHDDEDVFVVHYFLVQEECGPDENMG